jgi:hypothetical protein
MFLLGAILLGLAKAGPPKPAAAPITTHYRIETKTETTVDLSGVGQPNQQVNLGVVSWIAVTLSDTTGGKVVHVEVDSLKYDGGAPQLTQASVDSARGGTLHAFINGKGHLENIVAHPGENAFLADVQGVIHSFFPKVRVGAKAGDTWVDTVEVNNNQNGSNITSKFTINYTAGEHSTISGVQAIKLSAKSSATMSGTAQNPMGGPMEIEGTVNGSSESYIGADGRYLGGNSSATSNQLLKVAMAPAPIPVKTLRTVTVSLIP